MLGEADFDLSKYANEERAMEDRLPVKNCSFDPNAYIEIYIKAKVLEAAPQNSSRVNNSLNISMPIIEERDSEFDVREELEKKEKEYKKNIERLEEHLEELKRLNDEKLNENNNTLNST
jgi:vacuolar-type H+-ATPase subunit I/STV1